MLEREKEELGQELKSCLERETSTNLKLKQAKQSLKYLENECLDLQRKFDDEIEKLRERNSQLSLEIDRSSSKSKPKKV